MQKAAFRSSYDAQTSLRCCTKTRAGRRGLRKQPQGCQPTASSMPPRNLEALQRADIVGPLEGKRVWAGGEAHAAAHLCDRRVAVLLHPPIHIGFQDTQVF